MTVLITKNQENLNGFKREAIPFANARAGFRALLEALGARASDEVLLPSYVGYSKNEGSGVFDPVREVGAGFSFYRMTRNLEIDLDDLGVKLARCPRVVVFIHFFGYPDRAIEKAVQMARRTKAIILEDEAHALYSDWVTGLCGRWGDVALLSVHKMLPFPTGGLLVMNNTLDPSLCAKLRQSPARSALLREPLDYDLFTIAAIRRHHADRIHQLLSPLAGRIDPLFGAVPDGVVPHSLPVIVRSHSRDHLYFAMNDRGFGAVSLYHTLISEITEREFPDSHWLSRVILNMPVHQDVSDEGLQAMVEELSRLCRG